MKRIMIIDDDPVVLRIMRMGLESAGFEVESAANGSDGFTKVCESTPDLLVTDIQMPGMTGKELCMAIAKEFPECTLPIVVLTGRTELEHREWTRDFSNLHFMEKPVSIRRLIAHASDVLSG